MMRTFVVTPPEPVVTWEEAEKHLRLAGDEDERSTVEAMIAAATAHIDGPRGWLGSAIGVQTLEACMPAFGMCRSIALPYPPAIDVVSLEYVDGLGGVVTVDEADYELRGSILRPAFGKSWPTARWDGADGETVRVRYRAGYETVPAPIRAAILLMVGDLFAARETFAPGTVNAVPMTMTVDNLLAPYRRWY